MMAGLEAWLNSDLMKKSLEAVNAWEDDDGDNDDEGLAELLHELEETTFVQQALAEEAALGPGEALRSSGETIDSYVAALAADGVDRIRGCLSHETASALREYVLDDLRRAVASPDAAIDSVGASDGLPTKEARFSKVQTPSVESLGGKFGGVATHTRWDFRLPREAPLVQQALAELLGPGRALGDTLEALCGDNAELWELSALVSSRGAAPQVIHRDIEWERGRRKLDEGLYTPVPLTAFVALQDVARDMGPTRFLPGTHDRGPLPSHATALLEELKATGGVTGSRSDAKLPPPLSPSLSPPCLLPSVVGLLRTGDAALYDSRLLHCGGANRSDKERVLFYVTFRRARSLKIFDPSRSILPADAGHIRLRDFRQVPGA